jgi:membrane protease YdiL (CAAX protease family)
MSTGTPLSMPPALPPRGPLSPRVRAPGLWSALGLIALYFLLQLALSVLAGFVVGLVEGLRHMGEPAGRIRDQVVAIMRQPDVVTLMVVVTVPLAALIALYVAHRLWPRLWSLPQPPGFGLCRPAAPSFYLAAVVLGLLLPPLGGLITQWLAHGHAVTQNVEQLGHSATPGLRMALALMVVSIGPLVEEVLFRGALLSALLQRLPVGASVAACVLLFGAVHLPGLHFKWYALPDLMLLALALCWLRLKSGSLWPAVLAHGVNNAVAMVALFVAIAQQHA